ncbi:MAG: response regulator [Chloroflexi bacterium]|nr:response regulator [Chloroflexota bacterium]
MGARWIAIIEDDPQILAAYRAALRGRYDLRCYSDGVKVVNEEWDADPPAAILLDLGLPLIDGWDLLYFLGTAGYGARVIVITGSTANRDRLADYAQANQVGQVLHKPVHVADVLAAIQSVIGVA